MIASYSLKDWYLVLMIFLNIGYVVYLYVKYLVLPYYQEFMADLYYEDPPRSQYLR
jgi:hypothetical protein